jgi:7-cyano-7-deazaguanine synthase
LFLTVAGGIAISEKIDDVVIGVNAVDFGGYPDCREEFIQSFVQTFRLATLNKKFTVHTPLLHKSKAEIFKMAEKFGVLDVILEKTMTCYLGCEDRNIWGMGCGKCPACVLRIKGWNDYKEMKK